MVWLVIAAVVLAACLGELLWRLVKFLWFALCLPFAMGRLALAEWRLARLRAARR